MLGALARVLRFYTRLPVPRLPGEKNPALLPDFASETWAIPLTGAIIGALAALVAYVGFTLGIAIAITATLTLATLVAITGCFHEDGLADSCDGLWGGATPERRLEIMKDSRIGSYGAAGLVLVLVLRLFGIVELLRLFGPLGLLVLPGIGAASRVLALIPTLLLPPAGANGLASAVPMPGAIALVIAGIIAAAILIAGAQPIELMAGAGIALAVAGGVVLALVPLFRAKIGGFTGDSLGAAQQVAEVVLLVALSTAAGWMGPS